jgi:hypothetical protein
VPLEPIDRSTYRPRTGGIEPPWRKNAYGDPRSSSS